MPISAMGLQNSNSAQAAQKFEPSPADPTTQPDTSETQSSPAVIIDVSEENLSSGNATQPVSAVSAVDNTSRLAAVPPKKIDEAAEISASRAQAERAREAYLMNALISQIGTAKATVSLRPLDEPATEPAAKASGSGNGEPDEVGVTTRISLTA